MGKAGWLYRERWVGKIPSVDAGR
ncbi:protein of unknown function [Candidatus Bipolaricaulis anaerobius]|uniref:Uncharacterized protein n=1 Tax=Candidatus Bipolaricaulis anaerobius TaxID=2026885 RepID=A0A2X3KTZ1_9BACT|nr:protein of unknown function [Candidatus Bipolaricaulis anaerobius]